MPRSLREANEQAEELADWFEVAGPSPDNQRPVEEYYLEYIAEAKHLVRADIGGLVVAARNAGATWHQVAGALNVSAAEAERRFSPVVDLARTAQMATRDLEPDAPVAELS